MKTITIDLYTINELPELSRKRAIEAMRTDDGYLDVAHGTAWGTIETSLEDVYGLSGLNVRGNIVDWSHAMGVTFDGTLLFDQVKRFLRDVPAGTYFHSVDVYACSDVYAGLMELSGLDIYDSLDDSATDSERIAAQDLEKRICNDIKAALVGIADKLFQLGKAEIEHSMLDETIADFLEANEYWFTVDGKPYFSR